MLIISSADKFIKVVIDEDGGMMRRRRRTNEGERVSERKGKRDLVCVSSDFKVCDLSFAKSVLDLKAV